MSEDTPAQRVVEFAVGLLGSNRYRAWEGCHCTILLSVLWSDLREIGPCSPSTTTQMSRDNLREVMTRHCGQRRRRTDCGCRTYSYCCSCNTVDVDVRYMKSGGN